MRIAVHKDGYLILEVRGNHRIRVHPTGVMEYAEGDTKSGAIPLNYILDESCPFRDKWKELDPAKLTEALANAWEDL